jgi:hypothetical protein
VCTETRDAFLGSLLAEPLHGLLEVLLIPDPVVREAEVTLDVVSFPSFDMRFGGGVDSVVNLVCVIILDMRMVLAPLLSCSSEVGC